MGLVDTDGVSLLIVFRVVNELHVPVTSFSDANRRREVNVTVAVALVVRRGHDRQLPQMWVLPFNVLQV